MTFDKIVYLNKFAKEGVTSALEYLALTLPNKLYKFYSLGDGKDDLKLKTLKNNQIWVDLFSNQNDPFEMINLNIDESSIKEKFNKIGNLVASKSISKEGYQKYLDFYKNK